MCRISRRTEKLFFGKQICAVPVVSWSTGLKPFCVCAEKDFVGRFLCTNITTESEFESKCKFKNEHFFRRFHINNMRPSAPCSRQMTVQILRIIHSFFFNTHEYEDEMRKKNETFIRIQCGNKSMLLSTWWFQITHSLVLLVQSQWIAKPFGCSQIYRLIKFSFQAFDEFAAWNFVLKFIYMFRCMPRAIRIGQRYRLKITERSFSHRIDANL